MARRVPAKSLRGPAGSSTGARASTSGTQEGRNAGGKSMCRACARACKRSLPGFLSSWVPNTTAPIQGCAAATPSPGPPDRGLKPPATRRDARLRGLAARVVGGALPVSADVPCGVVLILLRSPCQKPAKAGDPQSSLGFQPQAEGDGATSPTRSRPSVTSRSTRAISGAVVLRNLPWLGSAATLPGPCGEAGGRSTRMGVP